ncbi:coproporphyrinogen III oxidase family protein [Bordetella holmesii 35009]|nr:coproporphyrinogen III oxidase family protein [Bordetella holmesii 35009]
MSVDISAVKHYLLDLQSRIVSALEAAGGEALRSDNWQRPEGGGGLSRLIEGGRLLERGAVLFSHVTGSRLPPRPVRIALNWLAAPGRPWAYRWFCIHVIPTCPPRT